MIICYHAPSILRIVDRKNLDGMYTVKFEVNFSISGMCSLKCIVQRLQSILHIKFNRIYAKGCCYLFVSMD